MAGVVWKIMQGEFSGFAVGERCGGSKCLDGGVNILCIRSRSGGIEGRICCTES